VELPNIILHLTSADDNVPGMMLAYNRANRAVAILCNHQRAVPKNFDQQMENLQSKIDARRDAVKEAKREYKAAKSDYKAQRSVALQKYVIFLGVF
jgi:DNA topoisomerase-1